MSNSLLINFKDTRTKLGTDRTTLKRVADELGVSETAAVHIAINRLYFQLFTEEGQDYPTKEQVTQVNEAHGEIKDPTTSKQSLTDLF